MLHDAIHQTGYFRFFDIRYDSLRTVSILYDVPIALIVRSDARIDSLAAVKGKRINAGAPRSAEHLAFDTILAAKGWTTGDFSLVEELSSTQSVDTMAFCHGTIQVMLHIGVHPNNALRQLIRLCDARLADLFDADIQKLVDKHPAFSAITIPAGTYSSQKEEISTFGTFSVLVASIDLDVGTVSRIAQVIFRNRQQLKAVHPALLPFQKDAPPDDTLGIPPHPGVLKFFSERGS
jgi:TRAP transporter TAXI family solute receptor